MLNYLLELLDGVNVCTLVLLLLNLHGAQHTEAVLYNHSLQTKRTF